MDDCIFCKIVKGELPCYKIWEDEKHLAFLTTFPNTPGATVVIPKDHYDSYFANVPNDVLSELVKAAKQVAKKIDKNFDDVGRTGFVFEGFGINHLHVKLFPLHGTKSEEWKQRKSNIGKWFDFYEGYISSNDGPKANEEDLKFIADKLSK
ncbi:MAG: HIT family protein [Candidatus Shapirobacteria bacterium]